MKHSVLAIVTAAVLSSAAALAQQTTGSSTSPGATPGSTSGSSSDRYQSSDRSTSRSSTSSSSANASGSEAARTDEKFLKDFAQANASEVAAGQLAEQKAQNSDVKEFGKHMVDDHSKANSQLETLAGKYNVDVKEKPDMMHKAKTAMLEKKDGAKFDQAYIDAQVTDHQKTIELLNKEIKNGQDPSVKQFAQKTLPDVQHHLDMAKQLQAQVSGKNSSNRTSMRNSKSDKSDKSSS